MHDSSYQRGSKHLRFLELKTSDAGMSDYDFLLSSMLRMKKVTLSNPNQCGLQELEGRIGL